MSIKAKAKERECIPSPGWIPYSNTGSPWRGACSPCSSRKSEMLIVSLVIPQGGRFLAQARVQKTCPSEPADRSEVFVTPGDYKSDVGEGVQFSREVVTTI